MERWRGRVAVVTGASVGIGAAVCRRLVEEGMNVVGAARSHHKIQALAEELADKPGSLTAVKCDLTKDEDVLALFAEVKKKFGGVDVCVNNAGMSHCSSLLDGTPQEWREMLDVNVVALCLCTREAVASMRERNVDDGQIIHMNSMAGHFVPMHHRTHFYTSSKWAVTALTEGLRQELRDAKTHIRVAAISPGYIETEFAARMMKSEEVAKQTFENWKALQTSDIVASLIHILSAPPHVQIHDMLIWPM